jgi:sugar phosphate permease
MNAGNWFWIIFVISVVFSGVVLWPFERRSSAWLVVFILLALLGYHVFGPAVQ